MDLPVPPSSHGSDEARPEGAATTGHGRPARSNRSNASNEVNEVFDEPEDDGFNSDEFREWMRNRNRNGRQARNRRRDSSRGSEDRDEDERTNAGPAPEWDGESLTFQDYAIKARLWLATTRSKPRTRGPLLLQKLSKVPFETMKFLARDRRWMQNPDNGEELIDTMDKAEYFGDDRDEDLLSALAKVTFHVRREKQETHRSFFNRWETAMRKVVEHQVLLPDKYKGFLLVNALTLSETEIKAMLNYTRGSILPVDIKDWIRKHETKLQVSQVGLDSKKTGTSSRTSTNYFIAEEETDDEDDEVHSLEAALQELHDGEYPGDPSNVAEDEVQVLEEQEAAEILNTILTKKRSFMQTQKAKKMKELGRGYKPGSFNAKGKGKNTYSSTSTGKMPFRAGQYKMTIEEIKKVTRCGNCHKVGHWHRECPEPPREREQHLLETEEAVFCGLLEADGPPPEEPGLGLHEADGPPSEQPELSFLEADGLQPEEPELSFPEADGLQPEEPELSEPANHSSPKTGDFDADTVEPNHLDLNRKPMSPYKDRDVELEEREILFGESQSQTNVGNLVDPH